MIFALPLIILGETCIIWAIGSFTIYAFKINAEFTFLMALALDLILIIFKNIIKPIFMNGGEE